MFHFNTTKELLTQKLQEKYMQLLRNTYKKLSIIVFTFTFTFIFIFTFTFVYLNSQVFINWSL